MRRAFSMIEVMVALVILGIVISIFFQTNKYSTKNQGKTRSWTSESAVLEKTVETLRTDYSVTELQGLSKTWVDSSQGGARFYVAVVGSVASPSIATGFPPTMLAQVVVTVKKPGDTDSLTVTTVLWVN
ncbi:MAG: prepilin-type N-terminal cleavage/methylation domain-containing protein [Fibrobacteres bacterium]|nr:prepilin-type N-terminal cleavage/methylation domain-containing protein [Fibrobacterota bacterium]